MSSVDKKSFEYISKSMLAGGIAGSLAKTVVAPLDRLKILFQTSHSQYIPYQGSFSGSYRALRDITSSEGVRGLLRGHSATLLRIFPYAGIKFMMYEQTKVYLMPEKSKETGPRKFMSGSLAGCSAVIVTYPFDLLRVRLACNNIGVAETIKLISIESRFGLGFYRGILPTLIGMIPYAGISFYTYDTLKVLASKNSIFVSDTAPQNLSNLTTLGIGALSGMIAQSFSYPFEVIRRRIQVGKGSIRSTTRIIYASKGIGGFFVGLGLGYIKVTPMFAVSFLSYEYLKKKLKIS